MPLVMPELFGGNQNTNTSGNRPDVAHWTACLMGKKLGTETNETTFDKDALPAGYRVLGPGDYATMNHRPERLNIYTAEDGTVREVKSG